MPELWRASGERPAAAGPGLASQALEKAFEAKALLAELADPERGRECSDSRAGAELLVCRSDGRYAGDSADVRRGVSPGGGISSSLSSASSMRASKEEGRVLKHGFEIDG